MHGMLAKLGRTAAGGAWAAVLAVTLVGCVGDDARGPVDTDAPDTITEPVDEPTEPAGKTYDFSCHGQALPQKAADPVVVGALINDSYSGSLLSDVSVALIATEGDEVLAAGASKADGTATFEIATHNQAVRSYGRMSRDGHVTSYLYPSRPLWRDESNVFLPILSPAWREELAGHAGVALDPTAGIVAVIVTDCAGKRVEGATVTFDAPGVTVAYWDPTFTDASATQTTMNGHAWGFNVPAGEVLATVRFGDVVYRDWPVKSFADSRTLSWRAP
jgi:hypothetical protein